MSCCPRSPKIRRIPVRFLIAVMLFLTSMINTALNASMSFTLKHMTVQPTTSDVPYCNRVQDGPTSVNVTVQNYGPRYRWSQNEIWLIETGVLYGILTTSLPAGVLAEWLGPKNTICFPLFFAAGVNVLGAIGAGLGWGVAFACRFVCGLANGMIYPSMVCMIARWSPPQERARFASTIVARSLGSGLVFLMSEYVSLSMGWAWNVYIMFIVTAIYAVTFWFLTANQPEYHRLISRDEIKYIRACQGDTVSKEKQCPPIKAILKSTPFWALLILNYSNYWGVVLQLTMVPHYITTFMGAKHNDSAYLTMVPQLLRSISAIFFGWLSDFILARKYLRPTMCGKVFVVFSNFLPAIIFMSVGSVKCNLAAAIVLVILINILTASVAGSNDRLPFDLAPNFASTMYGMDVFVTQLSGFILPAIEKWILSYEKGSVGWTIIFLIGGGLYFATGVIYICFGSSKLQPWNTKSNSKEGKPEGPSAAMTPKLSTYVQH